MNIFRHFEAVVRETIDACVREGSLPEAMDLSRISVEPPRDAAHGDIATNAAMVLAKQASMKPRDIAEHISAGLRRNEDLAEVEVAGPGFINARLRPSFWQHRLGDIVSEGVSYGDTDIGAGRKINVEYVSANPTGPLHVAHARGAVFGDALANLLSKAGFDVTTEYYVNDAGAQVDKLAHSAHLRYREALGEDIGEIPDGYYPGEYMIAIGKALAASHGDRFVNEEESVWIDLFRDVAVSTLLEDIKADLKALGIEQEVFTSERALVDEGKVDDVLVTLTNAGLIYEGVLEPPKGKAAPEDWEPRQQTLFRATQFGDDTDRPLKKSDGSWTYFSNDIANHLSKFERGFSQMIDVWGADHGGYVKRMQSAVRAVTGEKSELIVKLCQIVHLKKSGQPFRMSKRAGNFITLRDLIDELGENGKDIVRFIMLTRKNDTQMDFDLDKAVEQSRDNPVFYVQYAHARCQSVLRTARETIGVATTADDAIRAADVSRLVDPAELDLIRLLCSWPRTVESAAESQEPHRIPFYLFDVASGFHSLWNMGKDNVSLRFIDADDVEATQARLALVTAVSTVIASGLGVLGVTPLDELR